MANASRQIRLAPGDAPGGFVKSGISVYTRRISRSAPHVALPKRRRSAAELIDATQEEMLALLAKLKWASGAMREKIEKQITIKEKFLAKLRSEIAP
jgi:hypothetical protein